MATKKQVSVRYLVESLLKKGSIDARLTSLENAAAMGTRLHKKIQKAAGDGYEKEVSLSITAELNDQEILIAGRADGVIRSEQGVTIDEIKTSERDFSELPEEQLDLYWYQGMCYGHILAQEEGVAEITVQLTYMQSITEEITRQQRLFSATELQVIFHELVGKYEEWLIFQQQWVNRRNASIQELRFPYGAYRPGQRELAVATYKTILAEKKLYAEAPTGTGKTISTLFPSIKAVGEGQIEKIFYLTAKTITRQVAEDALEGMQQKGLRLKSVTLTAKDKICFLDERICTPDHCPFANGYYDRLNAGLVDLLEHEHLLTREVIEKYARKHTLCPFELSLDVSLWCDAIVCDYNYLFDPTVYLRRFFQREKEAYLFLVDEAHNLVNRSKEMFSASLSKKHLLEVKNALGKTDKLLVNSLNGLNKQFCEYRKSCGEREFIKQSEPLESLMKPLVKLTEAVKAWLPLNLGHVAEKAVLGLYFEVLNYLKISELYDDHYVTYISQQGQEVVIKQLCLDPSLLLSKTLKKGKASVLFSASFSPLSYYQEILGGGEEGLAYQLGSPFDPDNQLLVIDDSIQTTYKERHGSIGAIAQALAQLIQGKVGNYLVFFPSYAYLESVLWAFSERYPTMATTVQAKSMSEEQREAFLEQFQEGPSTSLLGFCVLGGIFSEGIDLKGERLSGAAIVGVGLPQMSIEQEMLKTYYDHQMGRGFQYAYQIPGMNKVLQSAGRVIRDSQDIGVVLLLDQRFNTPVYRQYFPAHWQHAQVVSQPEQLGAKIKQFWQMKEGTHD